MSNDFVLTIDSVAPTQTATIVNYTRRCDCWSSQLRLRHVDQRHGAAAQRHDQRRAWCGEVVKVYEGTSLVGTATVTGTSWTYDLSALANGSTHTYTARVEDAAGNQGANSAGLTLSVDTTAPAQTVTISTYTDDYGSSTGSFVTGDDDRRPDAGA